MYAIIEAAAAATVIILLSHSFLPDFTVGHFVSRAQSSSFFRQPVIAAGLGVSKVP